MSLSPFLAIRSAVPYLASGNLITNLRGFLRVHHVLEPGASIEQTVTAFSDYQRLIAGIAQPQESPLDTVQRFHAAVLSESKLATSLPALNSEQDVESYFDHLAENLRRGLAILHELTESVGDPPEFNPEQVHNGFSEFLANKVFSSAEPELALDLIIDRYTHDVIVSKFTRAELFDQIIHSVFRITDADRRSRILLHLAEHVAQAGNRFTYDRPFLSLLQRFNPSKVEGFFDLFDILVREPRTRTSSQPFTSIDYKEFFSQFKTWMERGNEQRASQSKDLAVLSQEIGRYVESFGELIASHHQAEALCGLVHVIPWIMTPSRDDPSVVQFQRRALHEIFSRISPALLRDLNVTRRCHLYRDALMVSHHDDPEFLIVVAEKIVAAASAEELETTFKLLRGMTSTIEEEGVRSDLIAALAVLEENRRGTEPNGGPFR